MSTVQAASKVVVRRHDPYLRTTTTSSSTPASEESSSVVGISPIQVPVKSQQMMQCDSSMRSGTMSSVELTPRGDNKDDEEKMDGVVAVVDKDEPEVPCNKEATEAVVNYGDNKHSETAFEAENKDVTVATNKDDENNSSSESVERAQVRTMQHLLQNVPYLFLDTVAQSTSASQNRHHTGARVGDCVCTFSAPAHLAPKDNSVVIRDVFVAQLPFDMPLHALQELADLLCANEDEDQQDEANNSNKITILHAAPHYRKGRAYDGCAFVKMTEADAHRFIDTFHKKVLFDVDGVWVASAQEEIKEMTEYCAWMQEQRPDQRRRIMHTPTPFSAMTAEFALRGNSNNHARPQHHQFQFQHQQMMQQQQHGNGNGNNHGHFPRPMPFTAPAMPRSQQQQAQQYNNNYYHAPQQHFYNQQPSYNQQYGNRSPAPHQQGYNNYYNQNSGYSTAAAVPPQQQQYHHNGY